jgi:hypothetical protein
MVMRRWAFAIAALLLTASAAGCGQGPTLFSAVGKAEGSYSRALADALSPAAPSTLRHRAVTLQKGGNDILLNLGTGNTQQLDPVAGARGQLFANADYGWRIADTRSGLTNVQNIRTYGWESAAQQAQRG